MITAFVVDDEPMARKRLARQLSALSVRVSGEFPDAVSALSALDSRRPDVLFVDVQMRGASGLELAAQVGDRAAVVFVTAHREHAVSAFELASVDYLLKPVRAERLAEAVRRVQQRKPTPKVTVVAFERGTKEIVDAATIRSFRARDKYASFVVDGRELLTEESLVALEERLAPLGFMRVHRAALVRLSAVRALSLHEGSHSLRLDDGEVVPVSRRLAAQLRSRLG